MATTTTLINNDVTNLKINSNNSLEEPMEIDEIESKIESEKEDEEEGELSESSDDKEDSRPVRSRYENKVGGFITGIDIFREDDAKLHERAKRFSLDPNELNPLTENQIHDLYLSMGLSKNEAENKNTRLTALHMRGTDELSTKDIFSYFQDFAPASIEWINDTSCNVVWLDELSAARALLGLSKPIIGLEKKNKQQEEGDNLQIKEIHTSEGDVIMVVNEEDQDEISEKNSGIEISKIEAPIPPGKWRLAKTHPKAKFLLLRFAMKSDKKPPNAEKMSEYYRKHGNPNYGGIKGIITNSKKRKIRGLPTDNKNPWGDLAKNWNKDSNSNVSSTNNLNKRTSPQSPSSSFKPINPRIRYTVASNYDSDSSDSDDMEWSLRTKIPRMRMRADEEEAKVEKRKAKTKKIISIEVNRHRDSEINRYKESPGPVHDLRNKLGPGRDFLAPSQEKSKPADSLSDSENEEINYTNDLRNTLRNRVLNASSLRNRSLKSTGQDLRSKLNSRKDKNSFRDKSPLQIEFDNDHYYEIVGSDKD